jgi:hypothetical protein
MIGVGVTSSQFNEINRLKASRRCRSGSMFDQHLQRRSNKSRATPSLVYGDAWIEDVYRETMKIPRYDHPLGAMDAASRVAVDISTR